jgi:hypothetical protein
VIKKTITYTDFNDETVTEDFYFHLSEVDLVNLEVSQKEGLTESLQRIIKAEDVKTLIEIFQTIILNAYGQKSDDGRRFIKSKELQEEFKSTKAYSSLFMELITNTDEAIIFINGLVPPELIEQAAKLTQAQSQPLPDISVTPEEVTTVLSEVPKPKIVTRADITEMSQEELETLGARVASGEIELRD